MLGQWEVGHPFIWKVSDAAYFDLIAKAGFVTNNTSTVAFAENNTSAEASSYAVAEVYKFWLHYPGYLISLVVDEFQDFIQSYLFGGLSFISLRDLRNFLIYPTLAIILYFTMNLKYYGLLFLLAWPLLFNSTIFFLVFSSSGRFHIGTSTAPIILLVMATLTKWGFYADLRRTPIRAALALGITLITFNYLDILNKIMIESDQFRFGWSIISDPDNDLIVLDPDKIR